VKVEVNNETLDLFSFPIRFVCRISHVGVNYSINLAVNLARVLYFGIFLKKLYLLYLGTEGVQAFCMLLQLIWEQRWWTTRERRRVPASRRRRGVPEKEQYLKRGRGSTAAATREVEVAPPSPAPPLNSTEAEGIETGISLARARNSICLRNGRMGRYLGAHLFRTGLRRGEKF
jgi:hypothetical protein